MPSAFLRMNKTSYQKLQYLEMDMCCWLSLYCALAFAAAVLWLYHYDGRKRGDQGEKNGSVPVGNLGWPIIGETLDFIAAGYSARPASFMEKRKSLFGKVFKTHLLGTPIIVSTDWEVNKVIMQNHGTAFVPAYPKSVRELMGEDSILRLEGTVHKRVHSLIKTIMRSPDLKSRLTRMVENSVKNSLAAWKDQSVVCIQEETKKITFEVLVNLLMGVGPGEEFDLIRREFTEIMKGLICLPIKFPGTRMYKSLKAKSRLQEMVRKMVEGRLMEGGGKGTVPVDAMSALVAEMSEGEYLSVDFIAGNIVELMIPGEETVPTAMTLAVKYLSDSPAALRRLAEENGELRKRKVESGEEYTWTDYISMPFTQNVISETLRCANIVNGVWRRAVKDVEIKGYLIPEGWGVLASFTSVHMDDEIYEDPTRFDPWRWEKKGGAVNINQFTPFGGGQRLCPGMELSKIEIAIFLHHLVTTYRWEAEADEIMYFPTVKLKNMMTIWIKSLKNTHKSHS